MWAQSSGRYRFVSLLALPSVQSSFVVFPARPPTPLLLNRGDQNNTQWFIRFSGFGFCLSPVLLSRFLEEGKFGVFEYWSAVLRPFLYLAELGREIARQVCRGACTTTPFGRMKTESGLKRRAIQKMAARKAERYGDSDSDSDDPMMFLGHPSIDGLQAPEIVGLVSDATKEGKRWFPPDTEVVHEGNQIILSQGSVNSFALTWARARFGFHCLGTGFKMVYGVTLPKEILTHRFHEGCVARDWTSMPFTASAHQLHNLWLGCDSINVSGIVMDSSWRVEASGQVRSGEVQSGPVRSGNVVSMKNIFI